MCDKKEKCVKKVCQESFSATGKGEPRDLISNGAFS